MTDIGTAKRTAPAGPPPGHDGIAGPPMARMSYAAFEAVYRCPQEDPAIRRGNIAFWLALAGAAVVMIVVGFGA